MPAAAVIPAPIAYVKVVVVKTLVVRLRGVRSVLRVLTWASTAPTDPQGSVRDGVFRPCPA